MCWGATCCRGPGREPRSGWCGRLICSRRRAASAWCWRRSRPRRPNAVGIPTIGIGAGAGCDGQILVTQDLLGLFTDFKPRFVRHYEQLAARIEEAVGHWARDVREHAFPGPEESYHRAGEE